MKKKALVLTIVAVLLIVATACSGNSKKQEVPTDPIPKYTADQLRVESARGTQGVFIYNPDGTFSPIVNQFNGFTKTKDGSSPDRYMWWEENNQKVFETIPHFVKGSQLVLLYNTNSAVPKEYFLEEYEYLGYTVGAHFYRTDSGEMYLETKGTLANTYAGQQMVEIDDETEYLITSVNESEVLPLKNIDNNLKMLLGLEAGKKYEFGFWKGTKFLKMTTIADTQVFQSVDYINLGNAYSKTLDGYFIVNLPDNLTEGYYYFNGLGMFYFEEQ